MIDAERSRRGTVRPSRRSKHHGQRRPSGAMKLADIGQAVAAPRRDAALYRLEITSRALSIDERRLIAQAQAGDSLAFEELVRIHADRLYAVVMPLCRDSHEAEEVTQEAFLRAWRSIRGFDGRSQLFTWLYRIGVNEAKRRAQRGARRLRTVSLEESPGDPPDLTDAPEQRAERREARAALERSVHDLPLDYRAPLVLRDIEGLSTQQAAEILGLTEAAFKSRLHRARARVRKSLERARGQGPGA
jgi:RNA polymerase sigma-70 factor (ECF subfamily)